MVSTNKKARQKILYRAFLFFKFLTIRAQKLIQDISRGVDRNAINLHHVVEMRTGCLSAHSHLRDLISSFYPLPSLYENLAQVAVAGGHTKSMEDHNDLSDGVIIPDI
jgi:hypothetical protein